MEGRSFPVSARWQPQRVDVTHPPVFPYIGGHSDVSAFAPFPRPDSRPALRASFSLDPLIPTLPSSRLIVTSLPFSFRPRAGRSTSRRRALALLVVAVAVVAFARAEPEPSLRVETVPAGFAFHLAGAGGDGPWLLQHSPDGSEWDEVLFLEGVEGGREQPGIEIQRGALPDPEAREGLFRAVQLEEEDPFLRRFLTERTKWRLSGVDNYQYELRQHFGQISWHGIVLVTDGDVASFVTIDLQPPVVGTPEVPTIDRLFERIAGAMEAGAETIDVTWHPTYGYPVTCFIDISSLFLDEERGWTIEAFTPALP